MVMQLTCPYVGLQPFTEEERAYFFGREREVRIVSANLLAAKLTVLYGESGVGKSSLLMAGVVPALRSRPRTTVVLFRDWQRADAPAQLKTAVAQAADATAGRPLGLDARVPLDSLLFEVGRATGGATVVLLDQFEEYFLYHPPTTADDTFDAEFARAINRRDIDAGFLLSTREDSLSRLDRFRARIPTVLANPLRIRHLSSEDARAAIVKPLAVYNERTGTESVSIEPELVEALITQTSSGRVSMTQTSSTSGNASDGAPRVEAPYLQLVLMRLWDTEIQAVSPVLRAATLQLLGGAARIVRTHLDQVMSTLSAGDQALCADFFDRLVTPSGSKIACRLDDLKQWAGPDRAVQVEHVVSALAAPGARILRSVDPLPGQPPQYEVFHDVLAAGVLDWRQRQIEARERARLAREAADRERAEAEARSLEVEREHARNAATMLKRLKSAMAASGVLMVIAAVAGMIAWRQSVQAAEEAERAADAERLVERQRTQEALRFNELQRAAAQERAEQAERARVEAERLRQAAVKSEGEARRFAALAATREKQAVAALHEAERQKALAEEQRLVAEQQRQEAEQQRSRAESEASNAATALQRLRLAGAQDVLNSVYGASMAVDGIFGLRTRMLLSQLQQDAGLPVSGQLDDATYACVRRLSGLDAPARKLRLRALCAPAGSAPLEVPSASRAPAPPGIAAPRSDTPVSMNQEDSDEDSVDEASDEPPAGLGTFRPSAENAALQEFLNARIGAALNVDGMFGSLSAAALVRFQALTGLSQTGRPDDPTVACVNRVALFPASQTGDALRDVCRP